MTTKTQYGLLISIITAVATEGCAHHEAAIAGSSRSAPSAPPPRACPPAEDAASAQVQAPVQRSVPLAIMAGAVEPLQGDDPTLPDQLLMTSRGKTLEGSYKMCINTQGKVQSVTPVLGIEGADRCVIDALKLWQFPKLPVMVCKLQTMRFEIP